MTTNIFYTRHDDGLTIFKNGKQSTVSSSQGNFKEILQALKNREFDKVEMLMSIEKTINTTGVSKKNAGCKVYVKNGKVYFSDTRNHKEEVLNGSLVDRILRDLGKSNTEKYADSLMSLLSNIKLNKSKDISLELYEWLASGKAPITSDGCILAYKKVRSDFLDQFSASMDNSPGKIVRMKQEYVDTNRANECSTGLHFASLGYLSNYAAGPGAKVVIVKVNPRHIFAIPKDYNCQKGRASEYFVVGEYDSEDKETKEAFTDSFVDEDNKQSAAPKVKFTNQGLKPSLETIAESYGLVEDGKVCIITLVSGKRILIKYDERFNYHAYQRDFLSFSTKSVRATVKHAVAKLEK